MFLRLSCTLSIILYALLCTKMKFSSVNIHYPDQCLFWMIKALSFKRFWHLSLPKYWAKSTRNNSLPFFFILLGIDWHRIYYCPCCFINLLIHIWVVFLIIRVSVVGYQYYILLQRTMLFRVWFYSYHLCCHNRHSIQFADDIRQQYLSFTNCTM